MDARDEPAGARDDDDGPADAEAPRDGDAMRERRASAGRVSFSSEGAHGGAASLRRRHSRQRRRSSMDASDARALRRATAMLFGDDDLSEPNDERAMESRRSSRLNGHALASAGAGAGGHDEEPGRGRRASGKANGSIAMSEDFLSRERNGELPHLAPLALADEGAGGLFADDAAACHRAGGAGDAEESDDDDCAPLAAHGKDGRPEGGAGRSAPRGAGRGDGCLAALRDFWGDVRESVVSTYRHLIAEYELNSNLIEAGLAEERSAPDAPDGGDGWGDDYGAFLAWGGAATKAQPEGTGRVFGGGAAGAGGEQGDRRRRGWFRRRQLRRGQLLSRIRLFVANPLVDLFSHVVILVCLILLLVQDDYTKHAWEVRESLEEVFVDDHVDSFQHIQSVLPDSFSSSGQHSFWRWFDGRFMPALYPDADGAGGEAAGNRTGTGAGAYALIEVAPAVFLYGHVRVMLSRRNKKQLCGEPVNMRSMASLSLAGDSCVAANGTDASARAWLPPPAAFGKYGRWMWLEKSSLVPNVHGWTGSHGDARYVVDLPRLWNGDSACEMTGVGGDALLPAGGQKVAVQNVMPFRTWASMAPSTAGRRREAMGSDGQANATVGAAADSDDRVAPSPVETTCQLGARAVVEAMRTDYLLDSETKAIILRLYVYNPVRAPRNAHHFLSRSRRERMYCH